MTELIAPNQTVQTEGGVFNWTNDEWAMRRLPFVRLASLAMLPDRHDALFAMDEAEAVTMVDELLDAAEHLKALPDLCAAAAIHVADTRGASRPN
jgi:hypothetical protein